MNTSSPRVWLAEPVIRRYLDGVRGGIPLAKEQLLLLVQLVGASGQPLHRFLDLGCGYVGVDCFFKICELALFGGIRPAQPRS
jgi:hypothetical protein